MLWGELRPDRPTDGLVEQVLAPLTPEPLERPLPRAPDGRGRAPRQQRLAQLHAAGQAIEAVPAKPQRVRVHAANGREQRHRDARGIVATAVDHAQPNAGKLDSVVLPVGWRARREAHGRELDPRQPCARPSAPVLHPAQHRGGVEPGSAHDLKGEPGAPSDRQICRLEQTGAGVMERALEVGHVGGRLHPRQAGGVVVRAPSPARCGHDDEVGVELVPLVREAQDLAERQAVAHRQRQEVEPFRVERARGLYVALQHHAADRVRAVRHDDPLAAARGFAHHEHRARGIGVVPGADVLQVDHDDVDAVQDREIGWARRGVEAVNWKPGGRVHGVGEPRAVLFAAEPVLGAEQHRQPITAGEQAVDVAAALTVDAGLVREQGQPLAGEQVRRVGQQDLDSRAHLSRGGRGTGEQPQQREMMRAHRLLVLAAVLGCAGAQAVGRTAASPLLAPALVDSLLRSLTVRQRVGQLVVPRLSGAYAALDDSLFQVAARWVDSLEVGGLIVFAGSPFDVAAKLNALQRRARLPLLVSADLEWGAGMRLVGATAFPMVMAAGATGDPGDAYTIATAAATEGRAVGIHVNFAPDADVNNNPANPIINTRSFGEDPRAVSRLVAEYVRGLRDHGMLATLKHFPGHGDTQIDSHIGLPRIAAGYGRLDSLELAPFRAGISAGADVVMSAHIVLPDLTGPEEPAM